MARESKKNREHTEPKRFSFSLSTAGLVSLSVVGVAALVWVFILGVLVGRGYKPEQAVPQLAEIMPRPGENASAAPAKDGVLKPEELEFFDTVKQKPAVPAKASKPETKPAKAEAPAAAQPAQAAATAQADDGQVFRYVYQAAALKSPDMAREFVTRLKKLGLSVSIEEAKAGDAVWHRVMVHHTGTPESTRELKAKLKTVGVDKPLMKSKTPAKAGAN
ncbi:SPOR domain-containing protein [Desulfocurvus sp. DL9XJH121]